MKPYHIQIDFDDGMTESSCIVTSVQVIAGETQVMIAEEEGLAEVFPDSNAFDLVTEYLKNNVHATVVQIPFSL